MLCHNLNIKDTVEKAIQKYKNHPYIQMIKQTSGTKKAFSFDFILLDTILKEIAFVDANKINMVMKYQLRLLKQMLIYFEILNLMLIMNLRFLAIFCFF